MAAIEDEVQRMGPSLVNEMLSLWCPLRLGWMIRRGPIIGPGFPSEAEIQKVKGISIKTGAASCAEPLASWMKPPEFYEEILERPNAAYWLFDGRKPSRLPYGVALAYRSVGGEVKLMWARARDLQRSATKWESLFLAKWAQLLAKPGLPCYGS